MKLGNYLCISALVLTVLTLSSCGKKHNEEIDGFAAPGTENDRVTVTLYGIQPLPHFEEAVENKFPNIDLVQYLYTGDYAECEFTARIKSGDTCDIMMAKAGRIALLDTTESLMDLSTMSFPANYTKNALPQNERGEIYFVPGPLSFNAYIYNKTLFEEHGWEVPESFEEYLALCRQIDDSGIRGCEFPLGHANMPMYVFCVRLAMDYMTTVEGQTWYEDFLAGRASSQEPLEDTLDVYSRMMDEGIIRVEDLSLSSEERLELLRNRQLAMTTAEINTIKALNEEGTDEFAFYPQYGVADNQGWLLSLGYYFGAGKYLEQPENMAKREAVMDILEFISTDEGQNLLIEDNIGMVSTVKGAVIPADKVFDGIRRAVMQGNYVTRPVLGSLIPVLQPELTSYIRGDISKKEIMQHCREVMEGKVKEEVSIGIAAENFDILETAQLKADTMREVLGTDVALMGVSEAGGFDPVQGVLSKLYAGTIGEQDVKRIAQRNDTVPVYCWTAQVKGEKLLEILDYGAYSEKEREAEETEHFHPYAVAGMKVRYERNARIGARIAEAAMVGGSAIEPDKSYSVAYLEGVLEPEQVSEPKRTGRLLTEVLTEKIKAEGCVKPGSVSIYYTFDIKE